MIELWIILKNEVKLCKEYDVSHTYGISILKNNNDCSVQHIKNHNDRIEIKDSSGNVVFNGPSDKFFISIS